MTLTTFQDSPTSAQQEVAPEANESMMDYPNQKSPNQIKRELAKATPKFDVKRMFDLAMCLVLLPFIIPIAGIVGLLILFDSPGPIFFRQKRIGYKGQAFTIYKFRTMYHKFDDSKHREYMKQYISGQAATQADGSFKPPIENQITKTGRFLRKTSLDELPQLINVLKGDMSIVGPRPHVEWEVQEYEAWHRLRLAVKPGITGLAQVNGRSSITFDLLIKYDIDYVRNQSMALDFQIMIQTVLAVLKRNGAG